MTFKEKLAMEHPEAVNEMHIGGCEFCPDTYGYESYKDCALRSIGGDDCMCSICWGRKIPGTEEEAKPRILDSGDRTEFETGAVRDMREGKGRCDLLPLDVVSECLADPTNSLDGVVFNIYSFQNHGDERSLHASIDLFKNERGWDEHTMLLEVAKHFEEGAKKYGDNNWRKGIPVRCYIDSAVRHYLKYLRGDKDEPHDRAFCWNILCAIWTCKHIPELNDYRKEEKDG